MIVKQIFSFRSSLIVMTSLLLTGFFGTACAESSDEAFLDCNDLAKRRSREVRATCSGTVVDKFRFRPISGFSAASSCGKDSQGNLFVTGCAYDHNIAHWVTRKSTDNGTTWVTKDDFQYQTGAATHSDIYPDFGTSAGNLYTVGFGYDSGGAKHWVVRKSADDGETWITVDDFQLAAGVSAVAVGFAADANGVLYVVGNAIDRAANTFWIVRKSGDKGKTWKTVDKFQIGPHTTAEACAVTTDSNRNVYVSGSIGTSTGHSWVVRKSSDLGLTWQTADTYMHDDQYTSSWGIAADTLGNVYAVGYGYSGKGAVWIVRKSADDGQTWANVDEFQLAPDLISWARTVAIDDGGNVYVGGTAKDQADGHWLVKMSSDQGNTWTIVDDFQLKPKNGATVRGIGFDATGNVFSVGMASDRAGAFWVTRKLTCP